MNRNTWMPSTGISFGNTLKLSASTGWCLREQEFMVRELSTSSTKKKSGKEDQLSPTMILWCYLFPVIPKLIFS